MGLESGTWVSNLVAANPTGTDAESQGDDHIRLIKQLLQNTFPNAGKAFYFPRMLSKTANFTVVPADDGTTFIVDCTAGNVTVTLPAAGLLNGGWSVSFIKVDPSSNSIIIDPNGAENINGVATYTISGRYHGRTLRTDTLGWVIAINEAVEETGKKNILINGGFIIWQRNTNDTGVTTGRRFVADRWSVNTQAGTLSQVTRGGRFGQVRSPNCMVLVGATTVTGYTDLQQRALAANLGSVQNTIAAASLSFWILNQTGSPLTPTYFLQTPAALDNWTTPGTVKSGSFVTIPDQGMIKVLLPFAVGEIANFANIANGLSLIVRFPTGSLNATSKSIRVFDMMFEAQPDSDVLPSQFEVENYTDELMRCQRYYQKTFNQGIVPGSGLPNGGGVPLLFTQPKAALATSFAFYKYSAVMRTQPTVAFYNPTTAGSAQIRGAAANWTSTASSALGDDQMHVTGVSPAGSAVGDPSMIHIVLDAEL